jgi:hypothetical protein
MRPGGTMTLIAFAVNCALIVRSGGFRSESAAMTSCSGQWRPATVRHIFDNPNIGGDIEYLFGLDGSGTHVVLARSS